MSSLISRAADKHPAAMRQLYDTYKATAFTVALQLLGTDDAANEAVKTVFSKLFGSWQAIADEEAFRVLALTDVLGYCQKQLSRTDAKATRAPQDRRFLLPAPTAVPKLKALDAVLQTLPAYHRVLFVAEVTAALPAKAIAKLAKLDERTLTTALSDNRRNAEHILQAVGNGDTFDSVCEEAKATIPSVSPDTDKEVLAIIDRVCAESQTKRRKNRNKLFFAVGGIVLAVLFITFVLLGAAGVFDKKPPASAADLDPTHYATIDVQDHGTIKVALDAHYAPQTVDNFVKLAESGFYDGLTFHRIMEGFMMQGGCPDGDGTGGAEQNVVGEFAENGINNPIQHTRGAISMARADDMNSGSSQFFIVHEDNQPSLDGKYAAFGYVTEGMDVVDTICTEARPIDGNGTIPASEQPVITSITIEHIA